MSSSLKITEPPHEETLRPSLTVRSPEIRSGGSRLSTEHCAPLQAASQVHRLCSASQEPLREQFVERSEAEARTSEQTALRHQRMGIWKGGEGSSSSQQSDRLTGQLSVTSMSLSARADTFGVSGGQQSQSVSAAGPTLFPLPVVSFHRESFGTWRNVWFSTKGVGADACLGNTLHP